MTSPGHLKTSHTYCGFCGADTMSDVKDSRVTRWRGITVTRRRRLCYECEKRTTTLEIPVAVIKREWALLDMIKQLRVLIDKVTERKEEDDHLI